MIGQRYLLVLFLLCPFIINGQAKSTITIQAQIVDATKKEKLSYATVFNIRNKNGTASDLNGYFSLPKNTIGDTIEFSYLGYKQLTQVVSDSFPTTLFLEPETNVIDEIVITARSEYLYKIISHLKNNKSTEKSEAKAYLFLETKSKNQTTELLEAYYNGVFRNNSCESLDLKKGRIGIKPIENRYFHCTESSKLFVSYNCFSKSKIFPTNPLFLSKRKLKKTYNLELVKIFTKDLNKLYEIKFVPKGNQGSAFSGSMIINPQDNTLNYLKLNIQNSKIHPFLPIGGISIEAVDMSIIIEYHQMSKQAFVDKMQFDYSLNYKDKDDQDVSITTNVYTKAFEEDNTFVLPYFNFSAALHEDYRNITLGPYDSIFWDNQTHFRFYEKSDFIDSFVRENYIEHNFIIKEFDKPQLEFSYYKWDLKRLILKEADYETIEKSKLKRFEIDRYNFNVQLYLDLVSINGKPKMELYTVIDPVNTYYHFPINNTDHAFINIYFDLMEIERRRTLETLNVTDLTNPDLVQRIYDDAMKIFEQTAKKYTQEVNRGKNSVQMQKWNTIVKNELGVDNMALFSTEVK